MAHAARDTAGRTLSAARAALLSDARLDAYHRHINLELEGSTLTIEGEVDDVSQKKTGLRLVAAAPGVDWVIDHLRVKPAERMTDGQIRDHVCDALTQEPSFVECRIIQVVKGAEEVLRGAADGRGEVRVSVEDGVVTLDGELPSRVHKRLAGVLAWWVPGSRDVIDGLGVAPPEEDSDEELTDAVRMALEKDPFVDASQIAVQARSGTVTLQGWVPKASEQRMAERDAWYVFGVGEVVNAIAAG